VLVADSGFGDFIPDSLAAALAEGWAGRALVPVAGEFEGVITTPRRALSTARPEKYAVAASARPGHSVECSQHS
jgi:hypothetical protein